MSSPIPAEWLYEPPTTLVAGSPPFSTATALVFGAAQLSLDALQAGAEPNARGQFPRALEQLARVLLVVPVSASPAAAMRGHEAVWAWVQNLTSARDQHELAFIFVLPARTPKGFEQALATALAVPSIVPETTGHALWRRDGSLRDLLDLISRTRPMDRTPLVRRRLADAKHAVLAQLRAAARNEDPTSSVEAAKEVLAAFSGREHEIDLFCVPPCHRHGNLLRGWLNAAVTGDVTPAWLSTGRNQLPGWLIENENSRT